MCCIHIINHFLRLPSLLCCHMHIKIWVKEILNYLSAGECASAHIFRKALSFIFYHPNARIWRLYKRHMPPTRSVLSTQTIALLVFISLPSEKQGKKKSFCNSISIFQYPSWFKSWLGWMSQEGPLRLWAGSLPWLRRVSSESPEEQVWPLSRAVNQTDIDTCDG